MKITKKKNSKKLPLILGVTIPLLIIGVGGTYLVLNQHQASVENTVIEEYNRNDVDLNPSTSEQQDTGTTIKKDALDKGESSPSSDIAVSISAANQNGSVLQVRTIIDAVSSSGSCSIKLTSPSGKIVEKTASIQALSSSSTCQGFDIPTSELSVATWKLTVTATIGDKSGTVSQNIDIK